MAEILLKPLITEKMTNISEQYNRFGFIVNQDANKIQIKNAVEKTYGVSVAGVNTMVVAGKEKQRYTKSGVTKGIKSAYKKAIVSLVEGDSIDFYSNI